MAPVELYPPQHNAEGSSPNNQIRDGTESTTTTTNQSTAPPHLVPFDEIPERNLRIIKDAIAEVYRIHTPRDFQIEAINHLITNDDTYLILIRRTADGKSLVPLTVATIRRGIAIILVPLIGLGSDQVEKAIVVDHNVEAYHADEHKQLDGQLLRARLLGMEEDEIQHISAIVFLSASALKEESPWYSTIAELSRRGNISMLCIDEGHYVYQSGRSFRTDFTIAVENMSKLMDLMPRPVPRLVMSATLRQCDRDRVTELLGSMEPNISHGSLARRGTMFTCEVSGNPAATMKASSKKNLKTSPNAQQLLYTNSKTNAEGGLLDAADAMLETHRDAGGPDSIAHSFTGGDGIMMKAATMDAFTSYATLSGPGSIEEDGTVKLGKIQVLTGTSAVNAGISSDDLWYAKHKGFPASLYELVQEKGRVNRKMLAEPGAHTYEVHVSFDSYVSLYIRIHQNSDSTERKKQLVALHEVLDFLVTPTECYHSFIEKYFEYNADTEKEPCGLYCSFCRGLVPGFTGKFYKRQLVSFLSTSMFAGVARTTSCADFIKALKSKKEDIFHASNVPNKKMGPIHALALQLLSRGIISVDVVDRTKLGTDKLREEHLTVSLPNAPDSDGCIFPSYTIPSTWDGLNTV